MTAPKNLVDRLRTAAQSGREIIVPWDHDPFLFDEAADEIERLRTALQEIADGADAKVFVRATATRALAA